MITHRRVASLKTPAEFRGHLAALGIDLPLDDELRHGPASPLAQSYEVHGRTIGNRFAILPMEGWDGTADGRPTDLTTRRWRHFGLSGAKLIWGGEAVAVRADGRANPNQLLLTEATLPDLAALRKTLEDEHRHHFGATHDLLVGLQLTHSGRFARPCLKCRQEPVILYHHPVLDRKFGLSADQPVLRDVEIDRLVDDFVGAACQAQRAGFAFVDLKHCHGYLGHEFLSAVDRPGRYGGNFENRTRFLRSMVAGIRALAPDLIIGVRVSAVDWIPFRPGADGLGEPESFGTGLTNGHYPYAFGGDGTGLGMDLTEPVAFLRLLEALDIRLVCISVGSPYYNPHKQRPALFPPSDGYFPPEDPLIEVAQQIAITAQLKRQFPALAVVGSGYSYLQEWLPHVAQAAVRTGHTDFVGLGRMALSYPEMPADVLAGRTVQRKRICRTFSECTTAPRKGLVSGCYPLDPLYKGLPEAETLARIKRTAQCPVESGPVQET
jgi:2,4-dienoyl-CoA reductase-like NADH-dependent reductase (Old Yellow Enzyme family)